MANFLSTEILRANGLKQNGDRDGAVKNPRRRGTCAAAVTWQSKLRGYYNLPQNQQTNAAWEPVWRAQYQQSNMPVSLNLHPDILFNSAEELDDVSVSSEQVVVSRASASPILPPLRADSKGLFDEFPNSILVKILTEVLFFEDKLVHIFSRLDPYDPPATIQDARRPVGSGCSRIQGRIYIRKFQCPGVTSGLRLSANSEPVADRERATISLSRDTVIPGLLLAPLCVNRKFHSFGAHIFYNNNTFAFSTLGEFDRFVTGIGYTKFPITEKLTCYVLY